MAIDCVVLDFDGTFTQVEEEAAIACVRESLQLYRTHENKLRGWG